MRSAKRQNYTFKYGALFISICWIFEDHVTARVIQAEVTDERASYVYLALKGAIIGKFALVFLFVHSDAKVVLMCCKY